MKWCGPQTQFSHHRLQTPPQWLRLQIIHTICYRVIWATITKRSTSRCIRTRQTCSPSLSSLTDRRATTWMPRTRIQEHKKDILPALDSLPPPCMPKLLSTSRPISEPPPPTTRQLLGHRPAPQQWAHRNQSTGTLSQDPSTVSV